MSIVLNLLVNAIAVFVTAYILPGVSVNNFGTALLVSIVLGILNVIVKPILVILTLPVTILTLGLFTFIINALIILLVSAIVPGFHVQGILSAILFSLVLSIVSSILHQLTK